jgi:hypothetical protein
LNAVAQALGQIAHEIVGGFVGAGAHQPAGHQLGNRVHCRVGVHIAVVGMGFVILAHVLLLGANVGPDFVTLNLCARQIDHHSSLVHGAGLAHIGQQLQDRVLALAGNAASGIDACTLSQCAEDGNAVFDGELIHVTNSWLEMNYMPE